MTPLALFFTLVGLSLIGWLLGRLRADAFAPAVQRSSALPTHQGWIVALAALAPALLFLLVWSATAPALVTGEVLRSPAAALLPATGFDRAATLAEARALASGELTQGFHPLAARLAPAYAAAEARFAWIASGTALLLAVGGGGLALLRLRAGRSARTQLDRIVMLALLAASLLAILATAGIVASLLYEALRFFRIVPVGDFLLGTHWSPQFIDPVQPGANLGALPLFWGTFLIGAVIAMAVAAPFGLMSAVWLTQYAHPRTRRRVKPLLEVLAGVPTVVYGYFAALTVAPRVRDLGVALGIADASSESALAAGLVMGIMIIPFVSSMADDALAAVPRSLRDASLAVGATPSETVKRVLLPAALPGIVGGLLLGVSRAVGETMIVVMAASGVATLSANPFASATTVTKQIVDLLTGESAFDGAKTLAAFALGLTLFAVTLLLNIVALLVVKRFRQAYA